MTVTGYTHVAMELWGAIFCLIVAACVYGGKDIPSKEKRIMMELPLCDALLVFADAFAWMYRGNGSDIGRIIVPVSNFIVFLMSDVMLIVYTEYLVYHIGNDTKEKKVWHRTVITIAIIAIAFVVLNVFNHMYYYFDSDNFYHRNCLFPLTEVFGLIGSVINIYMIIKYRKKLGGTLFFSCIAYIILPVLAMIIQTFIYGIALLNIAITISVLWLFLIFQIGRNTKIKEQSERLIEQERIMNDMHIKIVLSQIQPHFLYNSLNAIYYLCEKDTPMAQNAISNFSDYLRGNLDSLKSNDNVLFQKELKHVKTYLALEQMRFDEYLKVEYDIQVTDFMLPPLSIQPLVENAVKYGVGKSKTGGTVTIATRELVDGYEIEVSDDGVGFDVNKQNDTSRSHIGIDNVRQRLWDMSKASLVITSEIGKGTTAVVKLPK